MYDRVSPNPTTLKFIHNTTFVDKIQTYLYIHTITYYILIVQRFEMVKDTHII